jgi:hypothetical protein
MDQFQFTAGDPVAATQARMLPRTYRELVWTLHGALK